MLENLGYPEVLRGTERLGRAADGYRRLAMAGRELLLVRQPDISLHL
jgi:hypothetical protein